MSQKIFSEKDLGLNGGTPLRKTALPGRRLFDKSELETVTAVFQEGWERGVDFSYQGKYEELYTKAFNEFQGGGGYADAVSSGTAALFVILQALNIPRGGQIVLSPVTDPGGVAPALMMGMKPIIADSCANSFNIGPQEFEKAITSRTKAVIITHMAGIPVDMDPICAIARDKGIRIIEDCSQAHGAKYKGKRVGCFGDMALFSTMFSKMHATGGCGGLIYTRDEGLYWRARGYADRGKPFQKPEKGPKDPGQYPFYALNFNQDEISCAIGLSTLKKLQDTIDKRVRIVKMINSGLSRCKAVRPIQIPGFAAISPFFLTVQVDCAKLRVPKAQFAEAIRAEGIWINPDYKFVVSEWKWIKEYVKEDIQTPHASQFREGSFNILFNERFTRQDVEDIIDSILKVESIYAP